jgi:hypothetical protein
MGKIKDERKWICKTHQAIGTNGLPISCKKYQKGCIFNKRFIPKQLKLFNDKK